jgi:hypothetical protein
LTQNKRLVREEGTARPRGGRLERGESARDEGRGRRDDEPESTGDRRSTARRGRPPLLSEFGDVNRGVFFAGVESAAIAMDVVSRVLRGAVDRAFDEDYTAPGDIVRGITGEADLAVYDLVNELRNVPRRLSHRFDDAVRSPRANQGERQRRADAGATTAADSPTTRERDNGR